MDELLDRAPCAFLSFDDAGTITLINSTLLDMLGYTRPELIGGSVEKIFPIGTRIFYQTHFFPLVRLHGRADEIFLLLRTRSGSDIGVLANAKRSERDGRYANDVVAIQVQERKKFEEELLRARKAAEETRAQMEEQRDELKRANELLEQHTAELEMAQEEQEVLTGELMDRTEQLERAREAAEEANRAKSIFLANMSHELRTPLNAISGYAELIELGVHGPVTDAQRQAIDRIKQSQRRLLRLVNDLLHFARIEAGRVEYNIETVDARTLIDEVLPLVELQARDSSLELAAEVPHGLHVRADREKAQQILLNLLSNAIKFTAAGGHIAVTATPVDGQVHIAVADTGRGIPNEMQEAVFDPFVQVRGDLAPAREGTGLGLAISRDLARGMGGDLTLRSQVGVGSTFTLVLQAGG